MYLPPLWFHRVTSLEFSVSVNTWSPAREKHIGDSLNSAGLPRRLIDLLGGTIHDKRNAPGAAAVFLRTVLRLGLDVVQVSCETIEEGGKEMAECMAGDDEKRDKSDDDDDGRFDDTVPPWRRLIHRLVDSRYLPDADAYLCGDYEPAKCPRVARLSSADIEDIEETARGVVRRLRPLVDLPNSHSRAAVEILLMDYAERVATFVAEPERACTFLRCVGEIHAWG